MPVNGRGTMHRALEYFSPNVLYQSIMMPKTSARINVSLQWNDLENLGPVR